MDQTREFESSLRDLIAFLKDYSEHWTKWFEQSLSLVEPSGNHSVMRTLDAFGGMGSFNDFYLPDPEKQRQLNNLREKIYGLAKNLKKQQDL